MPSLAGPVSRPKPEMTVTLFFFIRNSRPLVCLLTMAVLRLSTFSQLSCGRGDVVDAEFGGVLEVVPELGVEEESLGGDATDVEAGAAEDGVLLDERDFEAELAAANGGGVAGGAAADDGDVVDGLGIVSGKGDSVSARPLGRAVCIVQFNGARPCRLCRPYGASIFLGSYPRVAHSIRERLESSTLGYFPNTPPGCFCCCN